MRSSTILLRPFHTTCVGVSVSSVSTGSSTAATLPSSYHRGSVTVSTSMDRRRSQLTTTSITSAQCGTSSSSSSSSTPSSSFIAKPSVPHPTSTRDSCWCHFRSGYCSHHHYSTGTGRSNQYQRVPGAFRCSSSISCNGSYNGSQQPPLSHERSLTLGLSYTHHLGSTGTGTGSSYAGYSQYTGTHNSSNRSFSSNFTSFFSPTNSLTAKNATTPPTKKGSPPPPASMNPVEIANELLNIADNLQTAMVDDDADDDASSLKHRSLSSYESPMQSLFDDMYGNGPTTLGTTDEILRYEQTISAQQKVLSCGIMEHKLRFTTTSYGRTTLPPFVHNNEHRITCKVHVKDLPFTTVSHEYEILQQIVGIHRLQNNTLRLSSNHFGSRIENKRHLVSMMDRIISSCQRIALTLPTPTSTTPTSAIGTGVVPTDTITTIPTMTTTADGVANISDDIKTTDLSPSSATDGATTGSTPSSST